MSATTNAGRACDVIGALAWDEDGEKTISILWRYRHFPNWQTAVDAWANAAAEFQFARVACATPRTYAEAILYNPDNGKQRFVIVLCKGAAPTDAPGFFGSCCAACAAGRECSGGRMGGASGDALYLQCLAEGGDDATCKALAAGDVKGAAVAGAGLAAGAGCSALGAPELAGVCATAGSAIAQGVVDFFSGPSCEGWICSQDTPEAWAHWMTPEAIDLVNAAFNAWIVSSPDAAPYVDTAMPGGGSFVDAPLDPPVPSGTMRRAWLSRWYQTWVDAHGVGFLPPPASVSAVVASSAQLAASVAAAKAAHGAKLGAFFFGGIAPPAAKGPTVARKVTIGVALGGTLAAVAGGAWWARRKGWI